MSAAGGGPGRTAGGLSPARAGSYLDQAVRSGELVKGQRTSTAKALEVAKRHADAGRIAAARSVLLDAAAALPSTGDRGELKVALTELADSLG